MHEDGWISSRLRTHCDPVNRTSSMPGRRLRRRRAARRGVERRGRTELEVRHSLLVDLDDRELTRCAKRYEEGVPTHAWIDSVRLVVANARCRVEPQRGNRAHRRCGQVRKDYLVAMR